MREEELIQEIDKEWKACNPIDEGMGVEMAWIHIEQFDYIARHFYELGKNTTQSLQPLTDRYGCVQ